MNNKYLDNIPFRINFIKEILHDNDLNPLIDVDMTATEAFINNSNNNDSRIVLNKQLLNFNQVINQIGGKLVFIKGGTTGNVFKGFNPNDVNAPNYAVKVVPYPKKANYGRYTNVDRPENAEIMMLKVLSYFVVNKQTPHIVLPIGTFNTSIKPFLSLYKEGIVDNKKYKKFVEKYKKGELHNDVSILISEWANGGDLLQHIRDKGEDLTLREWQVIFFQLISVLVIIQTKYPSFRHNDLKANNVLIHHINRSRKNNLFKYKINGHVYIIPNIGYQIKLWDFDFACIDGVVNNSKVNAEWTDRINVNPKQNRYYDVHYFFNTLTKKGFYDKFWTSEKIPKSVKLFVKRIIPEKYRTGDNVAKRGRLLVDDEYMTPEYILQNDPFFRKFRPK